MQAYKIKHTKTSIKPTILRLWKEHTIIGYTLVWGVYVEVECN